MYQFKNYSDVTNSIVEFDTFKPPFWVTGGRKTVVWLCLNYGKQPKTPFQSLKRWFACISKH